MGGGGGGGGGGGPRFRILGGQGGPNSQQAHDVVMTSMRRRYVASTSLRRHVSTRFLINQCQIITVLILKSDIIENSRIELRGILPVQVGGLLGGGQRVCWPPSQIIGGGWPPWPPSSYAYVNIIAVLAWAATTMPMTVVPFLVVMIS